MMDREQKIRERANQIWEEEGRPEGSQEEHWRRAEEEIAAGEHVAAGEGTENWKAEAGLPNDQNSPGVMPIVIPPD